ncbi:hypothetical protein I302_101761 [Kwoniella bestiolae CBS 10118]|uniref:Uncharacterized protein n=1 Tax=Kwoniella bestiolae CBS 10118 TaxID=1296100 RepID=A0A1B9GD54_9TREE|nr:hypothetical protein I302_00441 [Kwoniella bestiolae CBS 10118]OCF28950.1 hypothetical protein I302_00441 [Kwoniella bestiolae CBS 10118]
MTKEYLSTSARGHHTPHGKLLCNVSCVSWKNFSEEHQERNSYIAKLFRVFSDPKEISVEWMKPKDAEPVFNPADTQPNEPFDPTVLQSLLVSPLPARLILHNTPYHAIPIFNVPIPLQISICTFPRSYFCLAEWHTPDCLGCSFQYRRRVIPQLMKAALENQQTWTIQTSTRSEWERGILSAYQIRKIIKEIKGNSAFYLEPPLRVLFHDAEKIDKVRKWCEDLIVGYEGEGGDDQ